jgi:CRISPR-associated protein Csx10
MRHVQLRIIALAPLAFAERKPGTQFRESAPYVPGATLYGALGAQLGQTHPELFYAIRCHNAYPSHDGDAWVRPLPATAIQPKGADSAPPHDSLYARVCWERQQPAALIYAPTDKDGRPWEGAGGRFYTLDGAQVRTRRVTQRALTRVGINRRRGTAEDRRLYSPLVLSEVTPMPPRDTQGRITDDATPVPQPTQFLGGVVVPESDAEVLLAALQHVTHLGGRQTTGLGAVETHVIGAPATAEAADAIERRITAMTQRFHAQVRLYTALGGAEWRDDAGNDAPLGAGAFFTINLLSDAILLDQGWLPTNTYTPEMLRAATGIDAQLVRSFALTKIVSGWNVSWRGPKPTSVATVMGGVFVFQAQRPLTTEEYAALARLQLDGIGERRAEGFGQVRVCDAFHVTQEIP